MRVIFITPFPRNFIAEESGELVAAPEGESNGALEFVDDS